MMPNITSEAILTPITVVSDPDDIDIYPYSPSEDTTVSQTTTKQTTTNPATMVPPERHNNDLQITLHLTLMDKVIVDTGRSCGIVNFELYRDKNLKVCIFYIHE